MNGSGGQAYEGSGYRVICVSPSAHRVIRTGSESIVREFRTERLAIEFFLSLVDARLDKYSKGTLCLDTINRKCNEKSNCQGCNTLVTGEYYSKYYGSERSKTCRKICPACYSKLPLTDKVKLYTSATTRVGINTKDSLASVPPDQVLRRKRQRDSGSVYIVGSGQTRKH